MSLSTANCLRAATGFLGKDERAGRVETTWLGDLFAVIAKRSWGRSRHSAVSAVTPRGTRATTNASSGISVSGRLRGAGPRVPIRRPALGRPSPPLEPRSSSTRSAARRSIRLRARRGRRPAPRPSSRSVRSSAAGRRSRSRRSRSARRSPWRALPLVRRLPLRPSARRVHLGPPHRSARPLQRRPRARRLHGTRPHHRRVAGRWSSVRPHAPPSPFVAWLPPRVPAGLPQPLRWPRPSARRPARRPAQKSGRRRRSVRPMLRSS